MAFNYAIFLSSKPDIFVHRPGAAAGIGIGATMSNGVPVCDPTVIVPILATEFQAYHSEYVAASGSLTQRTRQEYTDWVATQNASVDMSALLTSSFPTLLPQTRAVLLPYMAMLMGNEGVEKRDFRLALIAVLASNPPHPFDAHNVCKLIWAELVDGCSGDPINTILVLQDGSVDETTALDVLEKKLAHLLVAQRLASGV